MPALLSATSHFSLLRGVCSPEQLCLQASELGYDAIAITDRDNLYGLPEFLYQAKRHNLRAIIAAQLCDKGSEALLYAHGDAGYANLCRVISERHCDKHFSLARSVLADSAGLLIATENQELLGALHNRLPCFFRMRTSRRPPAVVGEQGIPCLVIPDCAFITVDERQRHRLLRAIDLNATLSCLAEEECLPADALLRPWSDVRQRFEVFDQALQATDAFAEAIRSRDTFGTVIFPQVDSQAKAFALLRRKAYEGASKRYGELSEDVIARLEYELKVIGDKGFSSYFIIVDDIVKQSPRTCGRGSAAASIVSYCLGITNVDPIRYNLMFERFLNIGRNDLPDIDIDFAWDERDGVIDYVFAKYGKEHAAMVATHGTFGMRMALREVARVHGLTEAEISVTTRRMPDLYWGSGTDISQEFQTAATARGTHLDPPWPDIIRQAQSILGMPCSIGTHCGGVVITPGPICREAPVQISAKGYPIVQWEKDGCEEMGLVKIDLLGNRSLAVIRDAIASMRAEGIVFDERRWDPASDAATIDLLARGKTMGVFYVESPAMRLLQERSKTGDFEHMTIHSSIIRPAAGRHTREYIRRLHGGSYEVEHPALAGILAETYGIMVYQEDVTKVAMGLAGFSVVDGEGLRKIMTKKNHRGKLEDYRSAFVEGCRPSGMNDRQIDGIWDQMVAFSGYSFCKPHSASYVQVSFQAAWLKKHYPAAFLAGVISNFGGFYSTQAYVSEAQRLGISVVPPDVNLSDAKCRSAGRELVVGLQHIKGLSQKGREGIIGNRQKHGVYASLEDMLERTLLDEADAERCVLAGACDILELQYNRSQLFWKLRRWYCQRGGAGMNDAPQLRAYSRQQLLAAQYRMLGFLTEIHPIILVRPQLRGDAILVKDIRRNVGRAITFYGWCVTARTVTTIKGAGMEFLTFEDETGIIEGVLFPKAYTQFARCVALQEAFWLRARVEEEFDVATVQVLEMKPIGKSSATAEKGDDTCSITEVSA
jgi:DNA polymerase-3 subunit alpha/error-prone DNA polymerase